MLGKKRKFYSTALLLIVYFELYMGFLLLVFFTPGWLAVYKQYVSLQTILMQEFSNLIMHQSYLEGLLQHRLLEATPDFWIPDFCMSGPLEFAFL